MNGEYMSLETAKRVRRYNILLKRIRVLKRENERLNNIINEIIKICEENEYLTLIKDIKKLKGSDK